MTNLPLCHWSNQLFSLREPSSTDVLVLLLNQPNRSQMTSKRGKNTSDTVTCGSYATSLFLPHFDVICVLLLNRRTASWNLFVTQENIIAEHNGKENLVIYASEKF